MNLTLGQHSPPVKSISSRTHAAVAAKISILLALVRRLKRRQKTIAKTQTRPTLRFGFRTAKRVMIEAMGTTAEDSEPIILLAAEYVLLEYW